MTYHVTLARPAARDIANKLPPAVASAVVEFIFGALADNPRRVGHELRNDLAGLWSARRGQYRVLYRIKDEEVTVVVVHVDHRRDVYRPR